MTYSYGLHGAPAVGGGLPGLPQRGAGGSGITAGGVIPVDAQFGYADEQPANAVEVGAIVEREDYPALSEMIPHTFEQTVQMPVSGLSAFTAQTVVAVSGDGSVIYAGAVTSSGTNQLQKTWSTFGDQFTEIGSWGAVGGLTCAAFTFTGEYLFRGLDSTGAANSITVFKLSGSAYTSVATLGGANWPVKLLAVSPDGALIAAASSTTTSDRERVKLWRRSGDTFTAVTLSVTTSDVVHSLAFSKDGSHLYVTASSASNAFKVYDVTGSAPSPITHGLDFSNFSRPFIVGVVSETELVFVSTSASSGKKIGCIVRSGNSFQIGTDVIETAFNNYGITTASIYGNPIISIDGGSGFAYTTGQGDSPAYASIRQFAKGTDGFYEVDPKLNFGGQIVASISASEDSKFLAIGNNVSPWLRVYGSESKMVARLNERSPTGQKLYIKG